MTATVDQALIEIRGELSGLRSDMRKATGIMDDFAKDTRKNMRNAAKSTDLFSRAIKGLAIGATVRSIVMANIEFERLSNKMLAATGSANVAQNAMSFVNAEAQRLGLDLTSAADGFAGFSASALRAGLTLGDTKQIFTDMSEAIVSLNLDPQRSSLVFRALEQIASKGVVQMEELKLQLGDSLPGALEIAARASGVQTQEFIKMVEAGEVLSKDFLPAFAKTIKEELGGSIEQAAQSTQANMNRLKNTFLELRIAVAEGGFMESFNTALKDVNDTLADEELQASLAAYADILGLIAEKALDAATNVGSLAVKTPFLASKNIQKLLTDTRNLFGASDPSITVPERFNDPERQAAIAEMMAQRDQMLAEGRAQTDGVSDDFTLGQDGGPDGFSTLGVDRTKIEEELQTLRDSFLEKEELELEHNARKLEQIQEFLNSEAVFTQEQKDLLLALEEGYEKKKTDIKAKHDKDRIKLEEKHNSVVDKMRQKNVDNAVSLLKGLVGENKTASLAILAVEKGLAIARMLINTEVAAMRALADLGPIAGAPVAAGIRLQGQIGAALIAASGLAEGASILGGGSSSGSSIGAGGNAVAVREVDDFGTPVNQNIGQNVNITVQGKVFDQDTIREIIDEINVAVDNNVTLNFSN